MAPATPTEEDGIDGLRQRKRADSRARVVDAAFDLFAERGYDGVTVAEICAAADIAPRTFFRYFPAKDDVLAEPARALAARLHAELSSAPPELSDVEALAVAMLATGTEVVADRERRARWFRVVKQAAAARTHPLLRLSEGERALAEVLVARSGGVVDWRVRLTVARGTAAFRVWLDDLVEGAEPDPLQHLHDVLTAP